MCEKLPDLQRKNITCVAHSLLHTPYRWGGDDPAGIDCSGMVIDCLQAVGLFPLKSDTTADGLYNKFRKNGIAEIPQPGDMVFWFDSEGKAYHVAIAIDRFHCITADRGGKRIKTLEDAIKHNAFIKIRRIDHRKDLPKVVNLFKIS